MKKKWLLIATLTLGIAVTGCGNLTASSAERTEAADIQDYLEEESYPTSSATELWVQFGDNGEAFAMNLEDNSTAATIAGYVGQSQWRLPVYSYDESDVMEYYDIPSRYEIPDNSEPMTEAHAGDVFYSEPNRIILYYHDAQLDGAYTKVGTFEATEDFVDAVENNPVLEGWGNQIIVISSAGQVQEETVVTMNVEVNGRTFRASLEENGAVDALVEMMENGPVTIDMSDYSGFEKVGALGTSLPTENSQTTTQAGDIVLYQGNQIVMFYGSNSWSYTRLGHVEDLTGWEEALGSGDVTVTFSLED